MSDKYVTLAEAAKLTPTRPAIGTIWRWCRRGLKSRSGKKVRLSHVRVGGRVLTTPEALDAFFAKLAEADCEYFDHEVSAPVLRKASRSENERSKAVEAAKGELKEVLR